MDKKTIALTAAASAVNIATLASRAIKTVPPTLQDEVVKPILKEYEEYLKKLTNEGRELEQRDIDNFIKIYDKLDAVVTQFNPPKPDFAVGGISSNPE